MQYRIKKVSVLLATLFLFTIMLPFMAQAATGDDQSIVTLVNQARTKAGLATLTYDKELSEQAANNLAYYQKTGQIPSTTMLTQIAKSGGYSSLGQTTVKGKDVNDLVQKQLTYYGSSSILNAKYNRIGLAIADTASGKICIQLLAYKKIDQQQPTTPTTPTKPTTPTTPTTQPATMNEMQQQVVDLVNAERAKYGLKPVVAKQDLTNVAQLKAQDMYQSKYFSHTSPNYGSPFDMMRKYGINYTAAGENIAMGQTTAAQVMQDWMNSSGHRANILNSSYNEIGVGVYKSYNGYGYIWVQEFARR